MRWTVYNGSPRVKKSNSDVLLGHLQAGLEEAGGEVAGHHYLAQSRKLDQQVAAYAAAERVLVVFPLYVDAMPSQVMGFFQALADRVGRDDNPPMAFLVHSGFPEACHSRTVERYLEKLCRRLGSEYLGTMVKGGSEGIQVMPPMMTKKLYRTMHELGRDLGQGGTPDPAHVATLAGRERYEGLSKLFMQLLVVTGLNNQYWKGELKKNGAWERRFDRPYAP